MPRTSVWQITAGLVCCVIVMRSNPAQVFVTGEVSVSGIVEAISRNTLIVRDDDGTRHHVIFQRREDRGIALSDGTPLASPVDAMVRGEIPATALKPTRVIRFRFTLNGRGKSDRPITNVTVLDVGDVDLGVVCNEQSEQPADSPPKDVSYDVSARVKLAKGKRLVVELPPDKSFRRKQVLAFSLAPDAVAHLESNDPARIEPGARVIELVAIRTNAGDLVARKLEVSNPKNETLEDKQDEALERKYRKFSPEPPAAPRLVRSQHFAFVTDVSDREWAVIQDKLERMVKVLEVFLGRRMTGVVVEGFVARDLDKFPTGLIDDEYGVEKIRRGEGVCVNSRLGPQRHARLYSCADHGVIQHECVHGLCHLTFGSSGPTWLAEGLAELGNYWKDGDQAIDVPPAIIAYLQNENPKRKLLDIAVPGRVVGDTWRDYAWRWALCHLLAKNPNYCDRFVPLAVGLMEERPGISFTSVYGPVADEISFEYDQFLATIGNGYRTDLTAWPWKAKFHRLPEWGDGTVKIAAKAGWQPSRVLVEEGVRYAVDAEGKWQITPAGQPVDADGGEDGRGRLVGAVFSNFSLSREIQFGVNTTFEPPVAGQLFLRCRDAWTELGDNDGELEVTIRRAR
jgi:hypothetical protein